MKLEMIQCIKCKQDMPKLRLEKYGYKSCVNCSTTGAYRVITTVNGEKDHTWNDIQLMTPEQYSQYERLEASSKGRKITPEFNNFDDDSGNLQGPFTILEEE